MTGWPVSPRLYGTAEPVPVRTDGSASADSCAGHEPQPDAWTLLRIQDPQENPPEKSTLTSEEELTDAASQGHMEGCRAPREPAAGTPAWCTTLTLFRAKSTGHSIPRHVHTHLTHLPTHTVIHSLLLSTSHTMPLI